MLLLLLVPAGLRYSVVDVSPPRPIVTSAPNMTLLDVCVAGDGPALPVLAGLYFRG
jgi:hypothetical protein